MVSFQTSCGATGLLWQGGDEEFGAFGGVAVFGAEAEEFAGGGGGAIHVDLDVDVCDRSVAPGCPASVPGGLQAHELRRIARLLAADSRVRGLDIAEVDATADAADARTVRLAALLVLEAAAGVALRA